MRKFVTWLGGACLCVCSSSCQGGPPQVPLLATARIAEDFDTYPLARVALVPVIYADVIAADTLEQRAMLNQTLYSEFARSMAQELVALSPEDMLEIPTSDPLRLGHYQPQTLIQLARRFRTQALLFVHVTQRKTYAPQQLSMTAELVGVDTGLVIWTASVHLDAADERVREGLRAFYYNFWNELDPGGDWRLSLLSPSRFTAFGAWQLARML